MFWLLWVWLGVLTLGFAWHHAALIRHAKVLNFLNARTRRASGR